MQIRINDEIIDFTLEKEHALGEVVDGIQDWLVTNGFAITGIRRNDSDLSFASRLEWQNDPVEEVASLDITAHHPTDLAYDKISAVVKYLQLIIDDANPDSPFIADLLIGVDDVTEMIDEVLPSQGFGADTLGVQFRNLAISTGIIGGTPVPKEEFARFIHFVSELIVILSSRMREISDPALEIKALAPKLKGFLKEVGGVAVLLQTGKDREAMIQLIKLIEILQKLLRLVHYLSEQALLDLGIIEIEGAKMTDFTAGLNGFLGELSEAMENGDSVLIGDLLEYEIEPKLNDFLLALERNGVI